MALPMTASPEEPIDATDRDPGATSGDCASRPIDDMVDQAQAAATFLKALAHEGRLLILCYLSSGEKSVTELEHLWARARRLSASNWRVSGWRGW